MTNGWGGQGENQATSCAFTTAITGSSTPTVRTRSLRWSTGCRGGATSASSLLQWTKRCADLFCRVGKGDVQEASGAKAPTQAKELVGAEAPTSCETVLFQLTDRRAET